MIKVDGPLQHLDVREALKMKKKDEDRLPLSTTGEHSEEFAAEQGDGTHRNSILRSIRRSQPRVSHIDRKRPLPSFLFLQ